MFGFGAFNFEVRDISITRLVDVFMMTRDILRSVSMHTPTQPDPTVLDSACTLMVDLIATESGPV